MAKRYDIDTDTLTPQQILEEFYETLSLEDKEKFSMSRVRDIIESPFLCMKKDLKADKLYVYRLQFFGTFYTTVNKAKSYLSSTEKNFKKGSVTERRFNEIKKMLDEFIKRKS